MFFKTRAEKNHLFSEDLNPKDRQEPDSLLYWRQLRNWKRSQGGISAPCCSKAERSTGLCRGQERGQDGLAPALPEGSEEKGQSWVQAAPGRSRAQTDLPGTQLHFIINRKFSCMVLGWIFQRSSLIFGCNFQASLES